MPLPLPASAPNAQFGHSLTSAQAVTSARTDRLLKISPAAGSLPTAIRFYAEDRDRWTALRGMALMTVALIVVFFAASGFVLTNISNGTEVRADRITVAVQLAQRTADTIARSREDECKKRGDRCRALEEQERKALADLAGARAEAKATADPQAHALHVDSNTMRTAQAAAMVLMCLCSGYLIAFGAGLVWPHSASARRPAAFTVGADN